MILLMLVQLVVMYLQQKLGPRWFVPKKWRLGPNEHNYFVDVPHRRHSLTDEESGAQEEMTCVICMNDIRHEVDAFGGVIEQPEQKRISRFKQIFSIGLPQRAGSEPAQPISVEMTDLSSSEDRADRPAIRDGQDRNSLNSLISESSTFEDSKSQFEPPVRVDISDSE